MAVTAPEPRFTYGDCVRWADGQRWELYEGEAVWMSPAPSRRHQEVLLALASQVQAQLRGRRCRAYIAPFDVRFPEGNEPDSAVETVLQPDLTVVCDPRKLDAAGCRGAPDWIVEVLSPSTESNDRVRKRALYERHGVGEYWLVDPEGETVEIFRRGAAGFETMGAERATGTSSPARVAVTVDWSLVFG